MLKEIETKGVHVYVCKKHELVVCMYCVCVYVCMYCVCVCMYLLCMCICMYVRYVS